MRNKLDQLLAMYAATRDSFTVALRFADGSIGTIVYFAIDSKAYPKERLKVFAAGRVPHLDNFRRLKGFSWPGFNKLNLWRQDNGQAGCAKAFVDAILAAAHCSLRWTNCWKSPGCVWNWLRRWFSAATEGR